MRPVIRALFVLSVFGVLAQHVSTGFLRELEMMPAVIDLIDQALRTFLTAPLGRGLAAKVLLGIGVVSAILTYTASSRAAGNRHSTW